MTESTIATSGESTAQPAAVILPLLVVGVIAAFLLSVALGPIPITLSEIGAALTGGGHLLEDAAVAADRIMRAQRSGAQQCRLGTNGGELARRQRETLAQFAEVLRLLAIGRRIDAFELLQRLNRAARRDRIGIEPPGAVRLLNALPRGDRVTGQRVDARRGEFADQALRPLGLVAAGKRQSGKGHGSIGRPHAHDPMMPPAPPASQRVAAGFSAGSYMCFSSIAANEAVRRCCRRRPPPPVSPRLLRASARRAWRRAP